MSVSVKRKPVYCGACSMDISNAVRVRCAQLGHSSASAADKASSNVSLTGSGTKKHDPIDSISTGPRSDGLVPTCEEFDLCGSCFCEGKEIGRHKRWHDYRVVTQHAYPIFTDDWGADEELLLISACQTFGIGNWQDIAEHIGSYRTREEVEAHYLATYIDSPNYPMPIDDVKLIDQDAFQARKKRRLEEARLRPVRKQAAGVDSGSLQAHFSSLSAIPPPKPLASAPTCHDLAGYMPGRLEFETEWENDAEALIKDMEFGLVHRYGGDDQPTREAAMAAHAKREGISIPVDDAALSGASRDPQTSAPSNRGLGSSGTAGASGDAAGASLASEMKADQNQTGDKGKEGDKEAEKTEDALQIWDETDDDLELKLTIMEIYNERIGRRLEAKHLVFDRGLLDYKNMAVLEKKRNRDERDIINRIKGFSRLHTSRDHEEFANGLLFEHLLRRKVAALQEYRQAGITTFAECERYDKDKAARISARSGTDRMRDQLLLSRSGLGRGSSMISSREGTPKPAGTGSHSTLSARRAPQLTFANSASLQLLTNAEEQLCAELRILPKPFLFAKQLLLREFARCSGRLSLEQALNLLHKLNARTVTRIYEEIFEGPDRSSLDHLEDGENSTSDSESDSSEEDVGNLMGELQELINLQQQQQQQQQQKIHVMEEDVAV